MSWQSDWQQCKHILCVRPDNLGDVIMMTPVFRALKESLPRAKVTLLTSSVGSNIVPFIPDIDDVIVYDAPWIENNTLNPETDITNVITELKKRHFDGVILLTNFSQNPLPLAFLAYLAGIPRILGYCRELPNKLINYWVPDTEPFTFPVHGITRQLNLLEKIGVKTKNDALSITIPKESVKNIKKKLEQDGINISKPLIVLHPGASLLRRQYPKDLFIESAQQLIQNFGYQIVLTGNGKEKVLTEEMQTHIGSGSFSLANKVSLDEFIGLISIADVVISNNTAPVHIAAAAGTPVVDMYARSNPEHTPWKVTHRILYFDIPLKIRTQNTALLYLIPTEEKPMPQPEHIVQAVKELWEGKNETELPKEMTTW